MISRLGSSLVPAGGLLACLLAASPAGAGGSAADYERAARLARECPRLFREMDLQASWSKDGSILWIRSQADPGKRVFERVDLATGTLAPAFDHARLAAVLAKAGGRPVDPQDLPVSSVKPDKDSFQFRSQDRWWTCRLPGIELAAMDAPPDSSGLRAPEEGPRKTQGGGRAVQLVFENRSQAEVRLFWLDFEGKRQAFGTLAPGQRHTQGTYAGHVWLATDPGGEPLGVLPAPEQDALVAIRGRVARAPRPPRPPSPGRSPDGKWEAYAKEGNLHLRRLADGRESRLSTDGAPGDGYDGHSLWWSPDSRTLAALRVKRAAPRVVTLVESSPRDQLQPKVHQIPYPKPGDPIDEPRVRLFDVANARPVPADDSLCPTPWELGEFAWSADGREFSFLYNQRGHQVERLVGLDARTGKARAIVTETSKTFIDYSQKTYLKRLPSIGGILWASERDGWNHLYLIDEASGRVRNRVTSGAWNVRSVVEVDESQRVILLQMVGFHRGQDPYFTHWARVNLDGSAFVALTESDGTHRLEFAPGGAHFLDTWSRVDHPPVTELRETATGKLVATLGKADDSALRRSGWLPPEPFVAKGRDGVTDIHGVICKPSVFDPGQKYPVVEQIYAGPHDAFVPKRFAPWHDLQSMAELGFVVVQIDGMGTNWRGKAFHDVCYKNLMDSGLPDRIAWLKAAAATRPWLDLSRVGIYGGSAGGQSALAALLRHGDFYKVAVADCGCHDNRMDKIWWNEAWMGWPVDQSYAENSNVTHAAKLTGRLLLFVGELDRNVDPASTLQVVNALEQADKDFDLVVMTGSGHGSAESPYGKRRRADFLVRHLLGVEPRHGAGP